MKAHPVILEADEGKAILGGRLTQLLLPVWELRAAARCPTRYMGLAPGDLLWVKEPFIEFIGWRKGHGQYGLAYGTLGTGARAPEHLNGIDRKVHHRRPECMRRAQSRLTLEVVHVTKARADGDEMVAVTFVVRAQNIDIFLGAAAA